MHSKNNIHILRVAVGTAILLFIPLTLTLFGSGVDGEGFNWDLGDFIIMGGLIFCTGLAIDFARNKTTDRISLVIATITIVTVFLLVWAELAVEIFGTPFAGS